MAPRLRWLFCVASLLLTKTLVLGEDFNRGLLQTRREQRDKEREEDALEAYYLQQASLNSEQETMLIFGTEEATTIVRKVEKANRKKQVRIFKDLWENAKGLTIVKSLAVLVDLYPKKAEYYYAVNSEAMDKAESDGYSFKVSEALYTAMAVADASNDHYNLLDALIYRMDTKDKESKGSGCRYIEFLFTDAESWAIDEGRTQEFFRGFDDKDYLPLTECYLPECKGTAAKCCSDKKAVSSGMCGCKVVDKKEGTMQCKHNLVWTAPRTIWLCSTQKCTSEEKCLCAPKKKGNEKEKDSTKDKSKDKTKNKDLEEEEKPTEKEKEKSGKRSTKAEKQKGERKAGKKSKAASKEFKKTSNKSSRSKKKDKRSSRGKGKA